MSATEALQAEVAEALLGVNRYNPTNTDLLEEYVAAQVAEAEYDGEANLSLLKLYQLNPDKWNSAVVVQVLLKALMALPDSDMTLCKSLIDAPHLEEAQLVAVFRLGELLERCQFRQVWEWLAAEPLASLVRPIHGFHKALQNFAAHTVHISYQTVERKVVEVLLGEPGAEELARVCAERGWVLGKDGVVQVADQQAKVKNKNIQEKVELTDVAPILAAAEAS